MAQKISAYRIPNEPCPKCGFIIMGATPVSGGRPRGFKKGNIIVCYDCEAILRVGPSSFIPLTSKEKKMLDPVSKRVLNITINRIRKQKKEQEGN